MFDGRRFWVPKFRSSTLQQTTRQWWSLTSCFGITNHSEAASLWLDKQDWANNKSGSPPSCADPFCHFGSPSELFDWQVRYLDIYLFYVYDFTWKDLPWCTRHLFSSMTGSIRKRSPTKCYICHQSNPSNVNKRAQVFYNITYQLKHLRLQLTRNENCTEHLDQTSVCTDDFWKY